jgi:REP element-mobilizing transposase RayT
VARTARIEHAGGVHHVTAKSPSRRLLFHDDQDRQWYLQLLATEIQLRGWRLFSYCLLSNHLHLLLETPHPDLGEGFKRIHEQFAVRINRSRSEGGHLFGARFYNKLVYSQRHLVACLRYIARNPVDAGICRLPREWPWGAHRALAGFSEPPPFLDVTGVLGYLAPKPGEARVNYVQLVATSNVELLADLARPGGNEWLIAARDEFLVGIAGIASFLGVSEATAYRRLSAARATQGTVPSFSFATQGTVP